MAVTGAMQYTSQDKMYQEIRLKSGSYKPNTHPHPPTHSQNKGHAHQHPAKQRSQSHPHHPHPVCKSCYMWVGVSFIGWVSVGVSLSFFGLIWVGVGVCDLFWLDVSTCDLFSAGFWQVLVGMTFSWLGVGGYDLSLTGCWWA